MDAISLALGILIGFGAAYAWFRRPSRKELDLAKEESRNVGSREGDIRVAYEDGRREGRSEAWNELSVQVTPFFRQSKLGLPGFRKYRVEIGHEYRLFVKGFPCLTPAEHISQTVETVEVDPEELASLASKLAREAVKGALGEVATILPPVRKG